MKRVKRAFWLSIHCAKRVFLPHSFYLRCWLNYKKIIILKFGYLCLFYRCHEHIEPLKTRKNVSINPRPRANVNRSNVCLRFQFSGQILHFAYMKNVFILLATKTLRRKSINALTFCFTLKIVFFDFFFSAEERFSTTDAHILPYAKCFLFNIALRVPAVKNMEYQPENR